MEALSPLRRKLSRGGQAGVVFPKTIDRRNPKIQHRLSFYARERRCSTLFLRGIPFDPRSAQTSIDPGVGTIGSLMGVRETDDG